MKICQATIIIDGKEKPMTLENIEKKLEDFTDNYSIIRTRANIISNVLSQCSEESPYTLI